jgi:hypothetical protein
MATKESVFVIRRVCFVVRFTLRPYRTNVERNANDFDYQSIIKRLRARTADSAN